MAIPRLERIRAASRLALPAIESVIPSIFS